MNVDFQPRPSVILEAGMALASDEARTILVSTGALRGMSDLDGRHVIRLDNSPERRNDLVQRLKVAGCNPKTDGTDWIRTGNFERFTGPPACACTPSSWPARWRGRYRPAPDLRSDRPIGSLVRSKNVLPRQHPADTDARCPRLVSTVRKASRRNGGELRSPAGPGDPRRPRACPA